MSLYLRVATAVLGAYLSLSGAAFADAPTGATIDGIRCDQAEGAVFHIHQHLSILERGQPVAVPSDVGRPVLGQCLYWLHTHTTDGIIHVESPTFRTFTLGNFFDVWGEPLTTSVAASAKTKSGRLRVYVDGRLFAGDPRTIELAQHTDVTLEAGPLQAGRAVHRLERSIGTLARACLAGAAGAVTTNVLHEVVRRATDQAPRVDLLGMQALAKITLALGGDAPSGRRLYVLTLLGDLLSNALYFALVATQQPARALETGTLLGLVAGAGAVVLPPRLGLSAVTTSRSAATQALTALLYTAGGVVAGAVYREGGSPEAQ